MKIQYGEFLDRHIDRGSDWDMMPIGAHASIRNQIRDNNETAGYEYYYKKDGKTYIIKNPTLIESLVARVTKKPGKRIVGYRKESTIVENTAKLKELLKAKEEEVSLTK